MSAFSGSHVQNKRYTKKQCVGLRIYFQYKHGNHIASGDEWENATALLINHMEHIISVNQADVNTRRIAIN